MIEGGPAVPLSACMLGSVLLAIGAVSLPSCSAAAVVLPRGWHPSHSLLPVRWICLGFGLCLGQVTRTAHAKLRGLENSPSQQTAHFRGVLLSGRQAKRSKFCGFWAENRFFGPLNIGLEKKLNRVDLSSKARRLRWSKNILEMVTH